MYSQLKSDTLGFFFLRQKMLIKNETLAGAPTNKQAWVGAGLLACESYFDESAKSRFCLIHGLLRASRSHNPTYIRTPVGLSPHFALM